MKTCLLAIDIGTSGAKLLLLDSQTGQRDSCAVGYPTAVRQPGWAEQSPEDWWAAVVRGVPALLEKSGRTAGDIAAIGVDGMSWCPVYLDAEGNVVDAAPLWHDTRAREETEWLRRTLGEEAAFRISGNPLQPYYTYEKYLWLQKKKPAQAARVRTILSSNGYVVYRLTGRLSQDYSQAYGYPFFDMARQRWDEGAMAQLNMDPALLPPLCESTAIVGCTTRAAEACGLVAGIPVIAGGLDAACGAVGVGAITPEVLHEQSGSAGGMSICQRRCQPVRGLIISRHIVPGQWLLQGGTVGGGGLIPWMAGILGGDGAEGLNRLFDEAARLPDAAQVPVFLPYLAGERSPIWDPAAKGVFFGLDFSVTRGGMVKAVLEGAAMALRHNLDAALPQGTQATLRAVGGAARNPLWMQIKADVTGYPICASAGAETTAMGCAIAAGVACGAFPSFEEACARFVSLGETYVPDMARKPAYDRRYALYRQLYGDLRARMHQAD